MMAEEDSHKKRPATTKVCTTSHFGNAPLENQGFQRHKTSKIALFASQFAKSGLPLQGRPTRWGVAHF
jgi:hypothetical protein